MREALDESAAALEIFSDVMGVLSEKEWTSSGARKLMLHYHAQVVRENQRLREFREKFHQADSRVRQMEIELRKHRAFEMLHDFALGLGGAMVSLGPSIIESHKLAGSLVTLIGIAAIVGSTIAKWRASSAS